MNRVSNLVLSLVWYGKWSAVWCWKGLFWITLESITAEKIWWQELEAAGHRSQNQTKINVNAYLAISFLFSSRSLPTFSSFPDGAWGIRRKFRSAQPLRCLRHLKINWSVCVCVCVFVCVCVCVCVCESTSLFCLWKTWDVLCLFSSDLSFPFVLLSSLHICRTLPPCRWPFSWCACHSKHSVYKSPCAELCSVITSSRTQNQHGLQRNLVLPGWESVHGFPAASAILDITLLSTEPSSSFLVSWCSR